MKDKKKYKLNCNMIRYVRVPHEQFVAIQNKAKYLIVKDRDNGEYIWFDRTKEIDIKEMNKRVNEVLEKWSITKEEIEKNNKIIDSMMLNREVELMTENNITVNMENLSEDERNILLELIEKANNPKRKVWKPEIGEYYYLFYASGEIYCSDWYENTEDEKRYVFGNCFKTKEECEFAVEKLKIIAQLKRFAEENNECEIDWYNKNQEKYTIFYDAKFKVMRCSMWRSAKYSNAAYFTSQEIAEKAIKAIGEDRLKKYYFEVED